MLGNGPHTVCMHTSESFCLPSSIPFDSNAFIPYGCVPFNTFVADGCRMRMPETTRSLRPQRYNQNRIVILIVTRETMPSESKYEMLYREQSDVCGDPFPEFVRFAESYPTADAHVLDLGCGQGRDALLFARHGFNVTGVDISPTGIGQMMSRAKSEQLPVTGIVSDIRRFESDRVYDVVLLDRTLHMLSEPEERIRVLEHCAQMLSDSGHILIADERSNIRTFEEWFRHDRRRWEIATMKKPGFCFVQRMDEPV